MNKSIDTTFLDSTQLVDHAEALSVSDRARSVIESSRVIQILSGLLALQLVVALALVVQSSREADFAANDALVEFGSDDIEKIDISDGNDSVVLSKQSGDWKIEGDVVLPLQASRVETLLDSLSAMKPGLPVANSVNARDQLEVADDRFRRRLTVSGVAINPTTLLIGTSPGLRKSHVRRDGADDIYSALLSINDVPASVNQWLDKGLLSLSGVRSIKSDDLTVVLDADSDSATWKVAADTDEQRQLDDEKIQSAVQALQSLQVTGVAEPLADANGETSEISVQAGQGEITLTLSKDDQSHSVQRSGVAGVFSISESVYEKLLPLTDPVTFLKDDVKASESGDKIESSAGDKSLVETPETETAAAEEAASE